MAESKNPTAKWQAHRSTEILGKRGSFGQMQANGLNHAVSLTAVGDEFGSHGSVNSRCEVSRAGVGDGIRRQG